MTNLERAQDLYNQVGQGDILGAFDQYYADGVVMEEPRGVRKERQSAACTKSSLCPVWRPSTEWNSSPSQKMPPPKKFLLKLPWMLPLREEIVSIWNRSLYSSGTTDRSSTKDFTTTTKDKPFAYGNHEKKSRLARFGFCPNTTNDGKPSSVVANCGKDSPAHHALAKSLLAYGPLRFAQRVFYQRDSLRRRSLSDRF